MTPDWSSLAHAYGAADDLPEILGQLTPDQSTPVWGELWGRVCHQGTTYSASPHVLPILLNLANTWEGAARTMPLALAGDIVASREFKIAGFEQTVSDLRTIADQTAGSLELSQSDRIFVMSSALTFAGDLEWGPELVHLHDQEFMGVCTACSQELYLTIGDQGYFASIDDPIQGDVLREKIAPCDQSHLKDRRAWLCEKAIEAGDEELAARIRCVFGQARCPACQSTFQVAGAIERFWRS